jgi:hypothetical protein
MAGKPDGGGVAVACAVFIFLVLFSAFAYVACDKHDELPIDRPSSGSPDSPSAQTTQSPVAYTFSLTPVPLAPESTGRPSPPQAADDGLLWPLIRSLEDASP